MNELAEPCEECEESSSGPCSEGEGPEGVFGRLRECGHCYFTNFRECTCDCHDKEVKSE